MTEGLGRNRFKPFFEEAVFVGHRQLPATLDSLVTSDGLLICQDERIPFRSLPPIH